MTISIAAFEVVTTTQEEPENSYGERAMDIVGALTFAMLLAAHIAALVAIHELDYSENFRRRG